MQTYGNIQLCTNALVLYEYVGATYDCMRVINIFVCAQVMRVLRLHTSASKCHIRARTTHMRLCHIQTFSIRAPHPHKQTWALKLYDMTLRVK